MIKNIFNTALFFIISTSSFAQWNPIPDGHCFTPGGGSYFPNPPMYSISDNGIIFRTESYQVSASAGSAYDICRSNNDEASSNLFVFATSTVGSSCCTANRVNAINDTSVTYAIHYNPGALLGRYASGSGQTESLSLLSSFYNYASTPKCIYGVYNNNPSSIILAKIVNGVTSSGLLNYANIKYLPNIFFVNDSLGFIVGKDTLNANVVIRSDNYGSTWTKVLNPLDTINSFSFKGDTGLAVGSNGVVYRSFDKGNNWNLLPSFTTNKLNSIYIGSSSLCYAAGNNATLFKTVNMGNTWTQETLTITSHIDWVKIINNGGSYFQSQNKVYKKNYFASVKEFKSDEKILMVYPNPASSKITIRLDKKISDKFLVRITNSLGVIVIESNEIEIDVENISYGLFSVELKSSEGEIFRSKFIKINN